MGLAASQARFLGLTARKSNTEYQGQQINQQRTTLANESASLYSQLTNLTVPTPPDIINYYSTEYSFTYGGETYTLTSLPVKQGDNYTVALSHNKQINSYSEVAASDDLKSLAVSKGALGDYPELKTLLAGKNPDVTYADDYEIGLLSKNNQLYCKVDDKFYKHDYATQIETNVYSGVGITYSPTGDYKSIKVPGLTLDNEISIQSNKVTDDAAYNLAMNQYELDYAEYEKTMSAINAKTEVIQQQDKSLELKLNQLDTEQNAISTEMDAVQKVIEKNVESTFKTFA